MKQYNATHQPLKESFSKELVASDMAKYTEKNISPPAGCEEGLKAIYNSKPLVGKGGLVEISLLRKQQEF